MKVRKFSLIALLVLPVTLLGDQASWRHLGIKGNVSIFERTVTGSLYREFMGEGDVPVTLEECRTIMDNVQGYAGWMHACTHAREILPRQGATLFYYILSHSPWPVADRDGIYQCTEIREQGKLTYRVRALDRPDLVPLRKNTVRMVISDVSWIFTEKGEGVSMIYRIHSDPGGSLPASLYNGSGADIPANNINAFRKRVQSR